MKYPFHLGLLYLGLALRLMHPHSFCHPGVTDLRSPNGHGLHTLAQRAFQVACHLCLRGCRLCMPRAVTPGKFELKLFLIPALRVWHFLRFILIDSGKPPYPRDINWALERTVPSVFSPVFMQCP